MMEKELCLLIEVGDKIDLLFKQGKITKNKRGRMITKLNNYWNSRLYTSDKKINKLKEDLKK